MSKIAITTPVGEFQYAFITRPRDSLSGVSQYSINVILTPDDAQPLIDTIASLWKDSGIKKNPKSFGYKTLDDGSINFTFKTGAVLKDGSRGSVGVYDSKGAKVDLKDTLIGNGSKGRVKGQAAIYDAQTGSGVTLYLGSIQITKLVKYEGGSGFDAVEGEYTVGDDFSGMELDDAPFVPDAKPIKF
jgi:hypothetical protein